MICNHHFHTLREHFKLIAEAVVQEFQHDEGICVRRYQRLHDGGHIPVPAVEVSTHRPPFRPGEPPQHHVVGRVTLDYTNGGRIQRIDVTVNFERVCSFQGDAHCEYLSLPFNRSDVCTLLRTAVQAAAS